jgi:serine/threonine protein phosphatase PrpC
MNNYTFLQDIGGRTEQQDSLSIFTLEKQVFMVVADGMGGHQGGALASATLLNIAENHFLLNNREAQNPNAFFSAIVEETKERLKILSKGRNIDPNTTVVFSLIKDNILYYAYIGDSRLYIFEKKGKLLFRTRDDSLPEMLFKNNQIKEEEIATHPQQNVLTKSIGVNSTDTLTFGEYKLNRDKEYRIMLASDGLWAMINDEELYKELFSEHSVELSSKKLLSMAKYRGGKEGDNISIATIDIEKRGYPIKHFIGGFLFVLSIALGLYFYNSSSTTNSSTIENNHSNTIEEEKPYPNKKDAIPMNMNQNWTTG